MCMLVQDMTTLHALPYFSLDDHSRVVLSVPDSNGNDYINASFINVSGICISRVSACRYVCMQGCTCMYVHIETCTHTHIHTHVNYCIHIDIIQFFVYVCT